MRTSVITLSNDATLWLHDYVNEHGKQIASVAGSHVVVGAQNLYIENQGAFTGAVSTAMLASIGCTYVLCGHSERRTVFKDSDETVSRKVRVVCCDMCIS